MITPGNINATDRQGETAILGSGDGSGFGESGDKLGVLGARPQPRVVNYEPEVRNFNLAAKFGTASGWLVAEATDLPNFTLAASLTSKVLIVPCPGLHVGDKIIGFGVIGQGESAGGTATLDADLRKRTAAAADVTDASVATITQVSITADTALSKSNAGKRNFSEVLAADESLYVKITGTTAASTDWALQGVYLEIIPVVPSIGTPTVRRMFNGRAKIGATAGWAVIAVNSEQEWTLPASQTGSTLVVPLDGLQVGDEIQAYALVGQIESGGLAVTVDCQLRKLTTAAAALGDEMIASKLGSMTQLSVTADTILSAANAGLTGIGATVAAGDNFYLLVTATTLGSTDIDLQGALVTIKPVQNRAASLTMQGGKIGATAGWTVNAADDKAHSTVAASQTSSTLVVPISGLRIGDIITDFTLIGQIESASGTVTLDADLRRTTTAAADLTDASVATMTQVSVTADTALSVSNATKDSLSEEVKADQAYYLLLTATTAAATDIDLQGVAVTVQRGGLAGLVESLRLFGFIGQ